MKRLLLIVLPLLLIVGCSKPISEETLIDKDGLMYTPDSDKPYTGEVFTNYDTGEKSYQGTYENGLLVQYSYLNKDGSVKEPVNGETLIERSGLLYTVNGQKPYTGEVFELHDNGNKKLDGYYKDGLMNGDWVGWYENGQKEWEGSFDGSKVLEKIKFSYDDNGQKLTEDYYDNEDIYIDSRYFNNDGSLKDTVKFEEVKELRDGRDFLIVSKNTNKPFTGIVKVEENNNLFINGLKNGKLHGRYLIYKNGTLQELSTFKNHKLDGVMDHKIRGKGFFKDGLMVGEWTWIYGELDENTDSIKFEKLGELEIIKGGIDYGQREPKFPSWVNIYESINTYENIDFIFTIYSQGIKNSEISFIRGKKTYKEWNEDGSVME